MLSVCWLQRRHAAADEALGRVHDETMTKLATLGGVNRSVPAILSVAAHLTAVILGCLLARGTAPTREAAEPIRTAEIVLARRTTKRTDFFTDEQTLIESTRPTTVFKPIAIANNLHSADDDQPPPPLVELPDQPGTVGAADGLVPAAEIGRVGGRQILFPGLGDDKIIAAGSSIPREVEPMGPKAKLSLFGSADAEGRSFAFAIDRSQSMGGNGLGAISAAAKELTAQLDRLSAEQTFQVVAYNQSAVYFTRRELISADDTNKKALVRFIADLAAYGPTEHERGLLAALRLKPEVIFLLTDGGDPKLNDGQLRLIREKAAGRTSIHCLHFGRGALDEPDHFLRRLAAENRGSYVYIDMATR